MKYNSATQSWDASDSYLATAPNVTNNPSVTGDTTGATHVVNTANTSPTVVSNYNTQSKVNDINNQYQNHASTQTPSFPTGTKQPVIVQGDDGSEVVAGYAANEQDRQRIINSYGGQTSFNTPFSAPQDAQLQPNGTYLYQGNYYTKDQLSSPESLAAISNTSTQQKKYDEALQSELAAINKRYDMYRQQQEQVTSSGAAGAQNALLQSGAGGRGSVAQYAAATADERVKTIMADGQKALSELDSQRDQLLSAARVAYQDKNYKLLGDLNAQLTKNRDQMISLAKEKNEAIATETKNAQKTSDIASIYEQGITDPAAILGKLKEAGITNISAKEVADTLKNLSPEGTEDLLKTLKLNSAPSGVVQKTIQAIATGGLAAGLKEAGVYAQGGGTGIVGEYNYYKAQAEAAGQIPIDFNTYQNMDANRKAKVAAAGVAKTGEVGKDGLVKVTNKEIQDINQTITAKNSLIALVDSMITSINDYGTQVLFGGESGSRNAAKTNLLLAMKNLEKTGALDQGTIDVLAGTIPSSEFFATEAAQKAALQKLKDTIVSKTDEYIKSYSGTTAEIDPRTKRVFEEKTGDAIIKSEAQAKEAINKVYPTLSKEIRSALKTLYEANYTDGQVYEYLQSKGLIQ